MPDRLRALTVQQPFAWAIAYGGKNVENRIRQMHYRGPLAIHAGLGMHEGHLPAQTPEGHAAAVALDAIGGRGNCWNPRHRIPSALSPPPHPGLALGAVIALAEVTGCHWWEDCWRPGSGRLCSSWAMFDQYHIEISNVRVLPEPVPAKGMLGLWKVPEDTERAVRAQLEASHA
jgi:hypothetical protein